MKKFLVYVIVLIGMLFVGFTTYYFIQNKESIKLICGNDSILQYNEGSNFVLDDVLLHTQPDKGTTISVAVDDETILGYNKDSKTFSALTGGLAKVTITTNNANFARFTFSVHVGDGSINNPYFIKNATELASIGTGNWTLSNSYQIVNAIDLNTITTSNWTPIGQGDQFKGQFDGGNFEIYNFNLNVDMANAGLFDTVASGAKVEYVNLVSPKMQGSFENAGFIAGVNYGKIGLINISNGEIGNTNSNGYSGGIAGKSLYDIARPEIYMSSVENIKIDASHTIGGIAGEIKGGIITDCKVVADEFTLNNAPLTGGIVGSSAAYNGTNKYRHSVVRNCFAIFKQSALSNIGAIIGSNSDFTNTFNKINEYSNNYYFANGLTGFPNTSDGANNFISKPLNDFYTKTTYAGFNFDSIWTIEDGSSYATIDFTNTYTGTSVYDPGTVIKNTNELIIAINDIINLPSEDTTYEINLTDDTTITMADLGLTTWTPIGSQANPFKGKLIVNGDKKLIFKDFVIHNEPYAGFFGYMDASSEVNNVVFQDFKIYNDNNFVSDYTGTVVAYMLSGKVANCTVKGLDINTANIVGGAVGYASSGSVENIVVEGSDTQNYANKILANNANATIIGGVVGESNSASLTSLAVKNSAIEISINTTGSAVVGGVVGVNAKIATDLNNEAANIIELACSDLVVGGVAGRNRGAISASKTTLGFTLKDNNTSSYSGGVVGVNEQAGIINTSFVRDASLVGTYIGGIAGTNAGSISECYSMGDIKGKHIGGLASVTTGEIINCYTLASLEGMYDSGNVCGLAYEVREGKVSFCFSSATIKGKGTLSAETYSPFRLAGITKFLNGALNVQYGAVENCLVINYGDAVIQSSANSGFGRVIYEIFTLGVHDNYAGWIECSDTDCKGTGGFKAFVDNKFSSSIWNLDSTEDEYPTLRNVSYPTI